MKLAALGAFRSGSVVVRGVEVAVLPASQALMDALYALFPRPMPPLRQNPAKGSLAPPEPDELDPAYREEVLRWARRTDYIEVAAALDVEVEINGAAVTCRSDPASLKAWAERAGPMVAESFTREELRRVYDEVRRVADGFEGAAVKN